MSARPVPEIASVGNLRHAAALLNPLRLRILHAAHDPISATEIARGFRVPRQKINYHVRELARCGFLRRAGQRTRRNMIERQWQATARSWVLAPEILGPVGANAARVQDAFSAAYLLAFAARVQSELSGVMKDAERQRKRVATLTMDAEIRFASAEQRVRFTEALESAVAAAIAGQTAGGECDGRTFRLVVGCYPIPQQKKENDEQEKAPPA